MTLYEQQMRKVPSYYDGMWRDGFTPQEILYSAHKSMLAKAGYYEEHSKVNSQEQKTPTLDFKIKVNGKQVRL